MRPSRFLMPVSGRDITASSEFGSSPSSMLVEFCASAIRSQRIEIVTLKLGHLWSLKISAVRSLADI